MDGYLQGGVLFGPSVLGHKNMLTNVLFPMKGAVVLQTMATFCLNFFYFICCMKMDTATVLKTEKQAIVIGLSVFSFTLLVPLGVAFLLKIYVTLDKSLSESLPVLAVSQSVTVFISISVLQAELKILNSDIGRLAISSAMFSDVIGFSTVVLMFAILQSKNGSMLTLLWIILSIIAFLVIIIYVMRPAIVWAASRLNGKPVGEFFIVGIFLCVLLAGFLSEFLGQHFLGAIVLGLAVPEGPPIGTTLITKMETLTCGFLYPIYLAVSGLQTDVFKVDIQSTWIVSVIVGVGFTVKIFAVMLPGYFYNLSMKDCCVIGLILNGRGVAELSLFNIWKASKVCKLQLRSETSKFNSIQ